MPRVQRRGQRKVANLTWLQRLNLQVLDSGNLGFSSEREAYSAWEAVRETWMAQCGRGQNLFRRPGAWWRFEAPTDRKAGETAREFPRRHQLLTAEEWACLA